MKRACLPLLALAALAGCGGDRVVESANGAAPDIRIANPFHDELTALSPGRQRLAMMRAIRDNGYRCQRVDNAGFQEDYRNMKMWVASCAEERRNFAIYLAPGGEVQVRDCANAGELSLPRCNGLPPAVPDPTMPDFQEGAADEAFKNGQ